MSPDDPRHGEERGYFVHLREGEKACDACTRAHRAAGKRRHLLILNGQPAWVPAVGSRRRLQALAAIGWSQQDLAEQLGWKRREQVRGVTRQKHVTSRIAHQIATVYEALSETPGPTPAAASIARRRGWALPSAWLNIDDPDETPDPGWKPIGAGRTSRPKYELLEEFEWLVSQGESHEHAAAQLGVTLATVRDARTHLARQAATDTNQLGGVA